MPKPSRTGICPLCRRQTTLTFHHFIPRKVHRREHYKKHFDKQTLSQGVEICRLCHDGIHDFYDEMTLAKRFNSLAALKRDPGLRKHFAWVAKQRRDIAEPPH